MAPYIFRVALSNNRIVSVRDERVTFRYRDGDTKQLRTCTLPALAFIQRFLQHVLPTGFVKVRYYRLLRVGNRNVLAQVRAVLVPPATVKTAPTADAGLLGARATPAVLYCPTCGQPMQWVQSIARQRRAPPATTSGDR